MTKGLNQREIDILDLVARGNSYKKVARVMTLSLPTIKFYMGRAREKLGATSSPQAVAMFVQSSYYSVSTVSVAVEPKSSGSL